MATDSSKSRRRRKLPQQVRFVPRCKDDLAEYLDQPARFGYASFAEFARDLFDAVKRSDPFSGVVPFKHRYAEELRRAS